MISVYRLTHGGRCEWFLFKTTDVEKAIVRAFSYIEPNNLSGGFKFKFSKDAYITVKDRADFEEFRNVVLELM